MCFLLSSFFLFLEEGRREWNGMGPKDRVPWPKRPKVAREMRNPRVGEILETLSKQGQNLAFWPGTQRQHTGRQRGTQRQVRERNFIFPSFCTNPKPKEEEEDEWGHE